MVNDADQEGTMSGSQEGRDAVGERDEADAEIARLEAELAQPSEGELKARRLADLKAARAATRLAQFTAVAERRRIGIRRGAGSLAVELDRDAERFVAAVAGVVAAGKTFDERFQKYEALRVEDAALADRFGLGDADGVPSVVAPAVRADVVAAYDQLRGLWLAERTDAFWPQVEQDPTGLVARRTYAEIAGTPGYATIMDAGLRDFPPLTERQREIVAEREAERTRRAAQAKESAGALATEAARALRRPDGTPLA